MGFTKEDKKKIAREVRRGSAQHISTRIHKNKKRYSRKGKKIRFKQL
jgi:hypothetical protein